MPWRWLCPYHGAIVRFESESFEAFVLHAAHVSSWRWLTLTSQSIAIEGKSDFFAKNNSTCSFGKVTSRPRVRSERSEYRRSRSWPRLKME